MTKKKVATKTSKKKKVEEAPLPAAIELTNQHLTRQLDLIPINTLQEPITVIGCGAIGSFTVLSLAKMGFTNIQVFDDDTIEIENMNCQFFRNKDIGKPKAQALKELVKDFAPEVDLKVTVGKYTEGMFPGIVISAVDSMAARKLIWENHKDKAVNTRAIIDPRMGAEVALLFTMNPMNGEDIEAYEAGWYSDENAVQERCTAKATIYTALMLSGLVAKTVKDLVTKGPYPRTAQWSIKDNAFMAWSQVEEAQEEKTSGAA